MNRALSRLVVVSAFVISGCGGGSAGVDAAGAIVEATPLVTAVPMPTSVDEVVAESAVVPVPSEVVVEFSDGELIEAALLALDVDGVEGLFAWDVLESSVGSGGVVSLVLCGWTGETVFDGVYESLWSTEVSDAGSLSARELGTSVTAGECLNSELIDSALAFTREYDDFYRDVVAAPETFATDPRGAHLLTDGTYLIVEDALRMWEEDGLRGRGTHHDGGLPESSITPVLFRRFRTEFSPVLELATCRAMNPEHGLYRGEILVDDFRSDDTDFPHAMLRYSLVRQSEDLSWALDAEHEFVWTDCYFLGDWTKNVNDWEPDPVEWVEVSE